MSVTTDETNDPGLASWVDSANDPKTDFPIQNLPYGRFRTAARSPWRVAVAIGDRVLDLHAAGLIRSDDISEILGASPAERTALRRAISSCLKTGTADAQDCQRALLSPSAVSLGLPCEIGEYTD